jgi:septal ring factor EnvC (AmiA/AmiB activator)
MADPQVLTTLRRKQAEIENAIAAYEKRAEEARRDLAAIRAFAVS